MSINMKINVRWSIVLNATGKEWHELQHQVAEICEKQYSFTTPDRAFRRLDDKLIVSGEEFEVWARFTKDKDIEFAVLKSDA